MHIIPPCYVPAALSKIQAQLISWNIDSAVTPLYMGVNAGAFPEYTADARMPYILGVLQMFIDKQHPGVIFLQEARVYTLEDGTVLNSVIPVVKFLQSQGYTVLTQNYSDGYPNSFVYITAFRPDIYKLVDQRAYYLTATPNCPTDRNQTREEILTHNDGELLERCVFDVTLYNQKIDKKVHAINTHLGLSMPYRVTACKRLHGMIDDVIKDDPEIIVMCAGDFNTFSDCGGDEQIAVMEQPLSNGKQLIHKSLAPATFIAFPYDQIGEEFKAFVNPPFLNETERTPAARRNAIMNSFMGAETNGTGPRILSELDHYFLYGVKDVKTLVVLTPTQSLAGNFGEEMENFIVRFFTETTDVPMHLAQAMIREHINTCAQPIVSLSRTTSTGPYTKIVKQPEPALASDHQPYLIEFST